MDKARGVYLIGAYTTRFKRWSRISIKELACGAVLGVLADAGLSDGRDMESFWFGSVSPGSTGGGDKPRGQDCLSPLVGNCLLSERTPVTNLEGACAASMMGFHGAWKDISSGWRDVVLVVGVDRHNFMEEENLFAVSEYGIGWRRKESLLAAHRQAAREYGYGFNPEKGLNLLMEQYALQALLHMRRWGTTREQIAMAACKNHYNGSLNPKAFCQFEIPVDKVLEDHVTAYPLTSSMCAPEVDGGAAAILCSEDYLKNLPLETGRRAVRVMASVLANDRPRDACHELTGWASEKAYALAGVAAADVDIAEVHDPCSFGEIRQVEMLGFCPEGQGGRFTESGASRLDGSLPVNTSGGLVAKGQAAAAAGLSMISEIAAQLRDEAGPRQVDGARIGLVQHGDGLLSPDTAVCGVAILGKDVS